MLPAVRPGDRLWVRACLPHDACPGEVAVFRRGEHFLGHRVIGRGQDEQGAYLLTRADTNPMGDDGPIYAGELLGVVTRVERGGREVDFSLRRGGWRSRALVALLDQRDRAARVGWQGLLGGVNALQRTRLYRTAARRAAARSIQALRLAVEYPLNAALPLMIQLKPGEPLLPPGREQITLSLLAQTGAAVRLSFRRFPPACRFPGWWLVAVETRIRWRGLGLETQLFRRALTWFEAAGVQAVWAAVRFLPDLPPSLPVDTPAGRAACFSLPLEKPE